MNEEGRKGEEEGEKRATIGWSLKGDRFENNKNNNHYRKTEEGKKRRTRPTTRNSAADGCDGIHQGGSPYAARQAPSGWSGRSSLDPKEFGAESM